MRSAVRDGAVVSPGDTVLEGITRATVLELCAELGVPAETGTLSARALKAADEALEAAESEQRLLQGTAKDMIMVVEDALARLSLLDKELAPSWDVGAGRSEGDAPEGESVSLSHRQAIGIIAGDIEDAMKGAEGKSFDAGRRLRNAIAGLDSES